MTTPITEPKKGGCGRNILIVAVVLIVGALVCVGVVVAVAGPAISNVFNALAAPITANNDFMNALIAKDYTKAYGMIHPEQQEAFGGDAAGMEQVLSEQGLLPSSYSFTNVNIFNDQAMVNGTGVFGGKMKYVYLSLKKNGDAWKIIGLEVNENAPTATPAGG